MADIVSDAGAPEQLAAALKVLGNPLRIEILDRLRVAHPIGEIQVAVRRREGEAAPLRYAAKQTVRAHVAALEAVGLVERVRTQGQVLFAVRPGSLFRLVEELRRLSTQYAGHGVPEPATRTMLPTRSARRATGPRLVLVHGVFEGKLFPLGKRVRAWQLGRAEDCAVRLDYDPYLSDRHAAVIRSGRRFAVRDHGSKNGTWLNWRRLDAGEEATLEPGDVIGVGRSMLVFAA